MKKKILLALSFLAVIGLSVGGTIAYFTAQDTTVNTFTYGEVAIEQLQYEREVDTDGNWISTGEIDKYGYIPDKLVEYKNDNVLLPAVFAEGNIKWDDRNGGENATGEGSYQQSWAQVGASGSNQLFDDSVKNVHDNFVFVKNTGTNDAYVRTYFAFEKGNYEVKDIEDYFKVIQMNMDKDHWSWETLSVDYTIYDDQNVPNKYVVMSATYLGPSSKPTGILASGNTSYPSLLQMYMLPAATQEDIELLDGNNNGKYDVLVATQAVQADGFVGLYETGLEDANNAFTEAFGDNLPFKINIEETN